MWRKSSTTLSATMSCRSLMVPSITQSLRHLVPTFMFVTSNHRSTWPTTWNTWIAIKRPTSSTLNGGNITSPNLTDLGASCAKCSTTLPSPDNLTGTSINGGKKGALAVEIGNQWEPADLRCLLLGTSVCNVLVIVISTNSLCSLVRLSLPLACFLLCHVNS